MQLCAVPYLE